ncbi:helix-turn-helix transcriptional regulator [Hymenobacter sp.]|uniref:helix-turn-helix domain-containing protein n=1 Tax=Hymenobacter sp. TaxID=1898978 RepID=UPI00286D16B5|nr:helix-turn-helix transcriptional regulator [Hymenobacter sp.]
MIRFTAGAGEGLSAAVRRHFGFSQLELARLLGVSQVQVAQAETGPRPLPADARARLRALSGLLAPAPTGPAPPDDPAPLVKRRAACLDQARRLRHRLRHELPARAQPARHRLAAASALPAALAAALPLPPRAQDTQQAQLVLLHNAARTELTTRSGPTAEALLRARLAGLLAEANALAQALGEPADPDDSPPSLRPLA